MDGAGSARRELARAAIRRGCGVGVARSCDCHPISSPRPPRRAPRSSRCDDGTMTATSQPRAFRAAIPQARLDALAMKLRQHALRRDPRRPGQGLRDIAGPGASHRREVRDGYDWRSAEARLNAFPQVIVDVDGATVHAIHVRSPEPDATPAILTHGWPGTIFEFLDVIGPLTDPRAHGADPATAVHLVVPSLPGFAFSGITREPGWGGPGASPTPEVTLMSSLRPYVDASYAPRERDWGRSHLVILAQSAPRPDARRARYSGVRVHLRVLADLPDRDPRARGAGLGGRTVVRRRRTRHLGAL